MSTPIGLYIVSVLLYTIPKGKSKTESDIVSRQTSENDIVTTVKIKDSHHARN